jgi:hypothetical protein
MAYHFGDFYQQLWGETWGDTLCLCVRLAYVATCCQPLAPLVGKESLPMVRFFRLSEVREIT